MHSFGPELIADLLQASEVKRAFTGHRPDAPRAGWIGQIAVDRWIDCPSENALPWQSDDVATIG